MDPWSIRSAPLEGVRASPGRQIDASGSREDHAAHTALVLVDQVPLGRAVWATERVGLVQRALSSLNGADRQILVLTLVDGLSPISIAERFGLKPEAVRQRKSRAIRRVQDALRSRDETR